MKEFLTEVLDHEVVVLRNSDALPSSVGNSDLDILVRPDEGSRKIAEIRRILERQENSYIGIAQSDGFSKISTIGRLRGSKCFWGLCIDVFSGIRYRGADLIDVEFAFTVSQNISGIRALPDDAAAVIAVLKELLNNGKIPCKYLAGALDGFSGNERCMAKLLSPIGSRAFKRLRNICLSKLDGKKLKIQVALLRFEVAVAALRNAPLKYCQRRTAFTLWKIRRLISPPGLVVAVLGTDGVGKSTILNAIRPTLEKAIHAKVVVRHLRPTLLPALGALRVKNGSEAKEDSTCSPHAHAGAGYVGSLARLGWLWVDYVFGYWLLVRPAISRLPTIVLFDRYADDLAIDPRRFRIGKALPLAMLMPQLVPRPDLVIALHADPSVIHSRKQELPLAEVSRQVERLRSWSNCKKGFVLVETDCNIDEAQVLVLDALIEFTRERNFA